MKIDLEDKNSLSIVICVCVIALITVLTIGVGVGYKQCAHDIARNRIEIKTSVNDFNTLEYKIIRKNKSEWER